MDADGVVVYCIVSSFLSFLPAQCFQEWNKSYLNFEWNISRHFLECNFCKSYLTMEQNFMQYTFSEVSLISGKSLGIKIVPWIVKSS